MLERPAAARHRPLIAIVGVLVLSACAVDPTGPDGSGAVVQVVTGKAHACALTDDGAVLCWGDTRSGQAGQMVGPVSTPSRVDTELAFTEIAAGGDTTCGLTGDGAMYCWGNNALGQLGDGTGQNAFRPVAVSGGTSWSALSVGTYHVCGIDEQGRVVCWGGDRWDVVLGYPASRTCEAPSFEPTWPCAFEPLPDLGTAGPFEWVEAGLYQTCAGGAGAAAGCWGTNEVSQLGTTTTELCQGNDPLHPSDRDCSRAPVAPDGGAITYIQPGATHSCGLGGSGQILCWGGSALNYGQLGSGSFDGNPSPAPVEGGHQYSGVYSSHGPIIFTFSCGLETSGAALCWGANRFGQLGTGPSDRCEERNDVPCRPAPTPVAGGHAFESLALGTQFACGLTTGADVYCWGFNDQGQLADGSLEARFEPVRVAF